MMHCRACLLTAAALLLLGHAPIPRALAQKSLAPVKHSPPPVVPAAGIKSAQGFRVELLYTVPRATQGSWVNMTVDPKGRLIVSDQYGSLYRVVLPAKDGHSKTINVQKLDVPIGEAHGLLWAFDSLYVVVNRGRTYKSGLYRVRDTNGDDQLDSVELLRQIDGGGEHGPHGVVLGPDGRSLYVVAGNATRVPALSGSMVPRFWGEDNLLPRMHDPSFMIGEKAPGGFICKVSPDGKSWELVAIGFRNPFDLAFNRDGELFTYDSDMEWDIGAPWYRPTRACHVTSGAEFGYRNGAGKWPAYAIDSLPAVANVGPGSPTGVTFGYRAKFPTKYQQALFLCDWSYGRLYALHLKPVGATYAGELEEFLSGTPLALTDVVINPVDGAMYFAVGGRNTQSGLYRVTYDGAEPAEVEHPGKQVIPAAFALRRKLEAFHGRTDRKAVDIAWPYLGHNDRFIRWAARVAIEVQDPSIWRERALSESSSPAAALNALLALTHVSATDPAHRAPQTPAADPALRDRILTALERLEWSTLDHARQLDLLRVLQVVLNRFGRPDVAAVQRLISRLTPHYPARSRELNTELIQILAYLQGPQAVARTIALLEQAPTQQEQIEYARALRVLKTGWTPGLRKAYFSWFTRAAGFKGGNSLRGFLQNIKRDAMATLSDAEKAELKPILDATPATTASAGTAPSRPFVKTWTLEELVPLVEGGLKDRDFDHGRTLFAEARCAACHRFVDDGGGLGPELSGVAGRFSVRDLLESIVLPSKTISDQYQAVTIATTRGKIVTGRIVNLSGNSFSVNSDMYDPNSTVSVRRDEIEEMKPSAVSMMPDGLLNSLHRDEVLDLVAYLMSRGNREHSMFRRTSR
jgi:putative heme-binding domain-containing protein